MLTKARAFSVLFLLVFACLPVHANLWGFLFRPQNNFFVTSTIFGTTDTNIFSSGVADCAANEYVYGFNSDGTIDCRNDESGGTQQTYPNVIPWTDVNVSDNITVEWGGLINVPYIPLETDIDANARGVMLPDTTCDANATCTAWADARYSDTNFETADYVSVAGDSNFAETMFSQSTFFDFNGSNKIDINAFTVENSPTKLIDIRESFSSNGGTGWNTGLSLNIDNWGSRAIDGIDSIINAQGNGGATAIYAEVTVNGASTWGVGQYNYVNVAADSSSESTAGYFWIDPDAIADTFAIQLDSQATYPADAGIRYYIGSKFLRGIDFNGADITHAGIDMRDNNILGVSDLNATSITSNFFGDGSGLTGVTTNVQVYPNELPWADVNIASYIPKKVAIDSNVWAAISTLFPVPDANILSYIPKEADIDNNALALMLPDTTCDNNATCSADRNAMFVPYIGADYDINTGSYGVKAFGDTNFNTMQVNNYFGTNIDITGTINTIEISSSGGDTGELSIGDNLLEWEADVRLDQDLSTTSSPSFLGLHVDNLFLNDNSIRSDTGTTSFDDDDIITTGDITANTADVGVGTFSASENIINVVPLVESGAGGVSVNALNFIVSASNSAGTIPWLIGVNGNAGHVSNKGFTGTIQNIACFNAALSLSGNTAAADPTIDNAYIFRGAVTKLFHTGTITNVYGISLPSINQGTNNWAIKTGLGRVEIGGDFNVQGGANFDGNFLVTGSGAFLDTLYAPAFVDSTPSYDKEASTALEELLATTSTNGKIDHDSLPVFTQVQIPRYEERLQYTCEIETVHEECSDLELEGTIEELEACATEKEVCKDRMKLTIIGYEEGRDIGATVTMLVEAIKAQDERINTMEAELCKLGVTSYC